MAVAARTGQSEAFHVRAALWAYLKEHGIAGPDRDPLLELIGFVVDPEGPRDVAEEHDHYLDGAAKQKR